LVTLQPQNSCRQSLHLFCFWKVEQVLIKAVYLLPAGADGWGAD
jgi:hypothetical protein